MNPLWTKIGLGALAIFGVGLAGIAAVNKGKEEVGQILGRAGSRIPLRLARMGFDLDGQRIGRIQTVDIRHDITGKASRVNITVALADAEGAAGLESCNLVASLDRDGTSPDGFHCAESAELGGLVEMGTVTFQPGDLARPLYLSRRVTERVERSGLRSLDATLRTDEQGQVSAQGRFDVMDRRNGLEQGTFSLTAGHAGAELLVRDDAGRSLLDVRAGENGLSVRVSERDGRRLLRLIEELKH